MVEEYPPPPMQRPDRKITLGALGGAVGVVLVWVFQATTGIIVPAEVGMSFSVVTTFGLQYFVEN